MFKTKGMPLIQKKTSLPMWFYPCFVSFFLFYPYFKTKGLTYLLEMLATKFDTILCVPFIIVNICKIHQFLQNFDSIYDKNPYKHTILSHNLHIIMKSQGTTIGYHVNIQIQVTLRSRSPHTNISIWHGIICSVLHKLETSNNNCRLSSTCQPELK